MAAARVLLDQDAHRGIEGGRATQQTFDVVLNSGIDPLLEIRWNRRDTDEDLGDEAHLSTWVGWTQTGPSDVFVGERKLGVLTPRDVEALAHEAREAGHGRDPIVAAGYLHPASAGWALRLVVRRDHPDGLHHVEEERT
jgi:hypothetical protein